MVKRRVTRVKPPRVVDDKMAVLFPGGDIKLLPVAFFPTASSPRNTYPGHRLVRVAPAGGYEWVAVSTIPASSTVGNK